MLALSFSKYKLPHYIFIILPLAAIILVLYWLNKSRSLNIKTWYIVQSIILIISLILSVFIIYYFNNSYPLYFVPVLLLVLYISWLFWKRFEMQRSIIMISVLAFIFVNLELNTFLYTSDRGLHELDKNSVGYQHIKNFDDFRVTHLNLKFLNPDTREEVTQKRYLIRLESIPSQ